MVKNVQELGFWRTSGLDRDFDIITFHVIHFWNPWDFRNKMKPYLRLFVTIWMIREVNNVTKIRVVEDIGCFNVGFDIVI